jgi:Protein of unknown function (DUF4232)
MTNRLYNARVRALAAGGVAAALAVAVVVATSATAATPAQASCQGISFSVLHNDQSGGVILPAGKYTVSSPNLGCKPASNFFTTFLNKYNNGIPGWTGKAIAKGWGTYSKNKSTTRFTVKWINAKGSVPLPSCTTSALKVSLGPANGTAGTTFYPLKFVNQGTTTCTLRGYPGVSAVTSSGKQIGKSASRISSKFSTVTLAPGKQQSSSVGIVDTGNFSAASCKPVTAAGLRIFPPNQSRAVTLKKKFSTCSSMASTSLEVSPVK